MAVDVVSRVSGFVYFFVWYNRQLLMHERWGVLWRGIERFYGLEVPRGRVVGREGRHGCHHMYNQVDSSGSEGSDDDSSDSGSIGSNDFSDGVSIEL